MTLKRCLSGQRSARESSSFRDDELSRRAISSHGSSHRFIGILSLMNALILATETLAAEPAGDDFMTAALVLLGVAMLIAAIATWIVTPKGEDHH